MLVLARVIAQGARNRDESRGAHFKPDFKERNDEEFLRTTLALHDGGTNGIPKINYVRSLDYSLNGKAVHVTDQVDIGLVKPRPRKYETAGAASAAAKGDSAVGNPAEKSLADKAGAAEGQYGAQAVKPKSTAGNPEVESR